MDAPFASADDVFRYLDSFHNMERGLPPRSFRLDRVAALASLAGNPHYGIPAVHIAGSKGKGSTSVLISSILAAAGYKTGLYVSPHVEDYRERITIAGTYLKEASYMAAGEALRKMVNGLKPGSLPGEEEPTFFELFTILAFLAYKIEGCDAMVIETGMGGRLDATNILDPLATVLTLIELEHTEYLGDTITLIAGEKAGIIKPRRPVFLARQCPEALAVFLATAEQRSAPIWYLPEAMEELDVKVDRDGTDLRLVFKDRSMFPRPLVCRLGLVGSVQGHNAALAALCVRRTFPDISDQEIERGLAAARIPARFERIAEDPPTIVDGAHTPNSVALAAETFKHIYKDGGVLLFACAAGKDADGMARILAPHFSRIYITRPGSFRKSDSESVWKSFLPFAPGAERLDDPEQALRAAIAAARERSQPLLIIGSFYLAAEVKQLMKKG